MPIYEITLPDSLKLYVEEQVIAGGYDNPSDYFQELVNEDQKRKAKERLENMLLDALETEPEEVTPDYWRQLREEALSRTRERNSVQP